MKTLFQKLQERNVSAKDNLKSGIIVVSQTFGASTNSYEFDEMSSTIEVTNFITRAKKLTEDDYLMCMVETYDGRSVTIY